MDLMDTAVKDSRVLYSRFHSDHENEALQADLARREALLSAQLGEKAEAEEKAKEERQRKAKAQIKEFMEDWRKTMHQHKQELLPEQTGVQSTERDPAESWKYIAKVISQRHNDYGGQQDVTRMKAVIANHAAYLSGDAV